MANRKLLIGIVSAASFGLLISVSLGIYKNSLVGKYPAGTYVAGVDLSYRLPSEARKILKEKAENYLKTPLKINVLGKTKEISPAALGIQVYIEETLQALNPTNIRQTSLFELLGIGPKQNERLDPVITISYEKLFSSLESNFKLSEIGPKSATFSLDKNGNLSIQDGKEGAAVDKDALIKTIKKTARNFSIADINVSTSNQKPLIGKVDLETQQERIKESLNQKITLLDPVYSDNWDLKLRDHLDWVNFVPKKKITLPLFKTTFFLEPDPSGPGENFVAIEINQQKLNNFVDEKISKWLDRPGQDVNIYTDESGKVIIEGKGSDGKKVQREQLKHAIELAIANKITNVPIPTISVAPKINISQDLKDKGVTERIAVGHTSYYGSPGNRVWNVKKGAEKFNGLLIAPDETFSFNKNLGAVDGSTGFKKELVIKPEGTIPEYGGGICQVSTTMFRAALFAGLPIVERNQHSYAVSYYSQILGHGLDATIYLGGPNLKFKNDTGQHILIQTYTESDYELYIVFYGTADGRRVEMEGPYLSNHVSPGPTEFVETTELAPGQKKSLEKAHVGFNAMWYRHLFNKEGVENKELFATHYKAIPAKILVGITPPAPHPAP